MVSLRGKAHHDLTASLTHLLFQSRTLAPSAGQHCLPRCKHKGNKSALQARAMQVVLSMQGGSTACH